MSHNPKGLLIKKILNQFLLTKRADAFKASATSYREFINKLGEYLIELFDYLVQHIVRALSLSLSFSGSLCICQELHFTHRTLVKLSNHSQIKHTYLNFFFLLLSLTPLNTILRPELKKHLILTNLWKPHSKLSLLIAYLDISINNISKYFI